jgi:hypothetical protein
VALAIRVVEAVPELLEHLAKAAQALQLAAAERAGHRVQVSLTQAEQENLQLEQSAQMAVQAEADY